jgi:ribosome-associated toxin RatA of RatAB toxin-antitoxin module
MQPGRRTLAAPRTEARMTRKATFAIVALLLLVTALPAQAIKYSLLEGSTINPQDLAQLMRQGSMMITKETPAGKLDLITSGVVINAPPDQVLAAISDFERYPEFMPSTEEVKVLSTDGDTRRVYFHIKFAFSVLSYTVEYTLKQHMVPGRGYWWELESGDLARAIGSWEVIPLEGGKKSAAIYSIYTDIRSIGKVVRYFIDKEPGMDVAINASTCLLVLKAVRSRVETGIYAKGAKN